MTWSYRIVKYNKGGCGIHEVYSHGYTEHAVRVVGNDLHDLAATLDLMRDALKHPVIMEKDNA